MTAPRSQQVQPDVTAYYHCMTRCVRQAFLLGSDDATGRRFDHRKRWVVDELARLERVFAVDICAYAVMSNHVHLVLRVDTESASRWSDDEIVARARKLFPGALQRAEEAGVLAVRVPEYRRRLSSLSWFMRCLNERIARRANQEDGCIGRFWEGRFKSRALLDVGAVLTCMAYVDLNPVHAGAAGSLADSDFTSIQDRLAAHARAVQDADSTVARGTAASASSRPTRAMTPTLLPFAEHSGPGGSQGGPTDAIPFDLASYVELVRFNGQAIRSDKRGSLPLGAHSVLRKAGLSPRRWGDALSAINTLRFAAIGERHLIDTFARRCGSRRACNAAWASMAYDGERVAHATPTSVPRPYVSAA